MQSSGTACCEFERRFSQLGPSWKISLLICSPNGVAGNVMFWPLNASLKENGRIETWLAGFSRDEQNKAQSSTSGAYAARARESDFRYVNRASVVSYIHASGRKAMRLCPGQKN